MNSPSVGPVLDSTGGLSTAYGVRSTPRRRWRAHGDDQGARDLADETAVALVHDAATYAVMMATPDDLEDFGVGFSLTEGVIARARDVRAIDVVRGELGVEVRMWLAPGLAGALAGRRRRLAGPTGCGLCGVESLEESARANGEVQGDGLRLAPIEIQAAMATLAPAQALGATTRATHAAGFWTREEGLVAVREDVGRHNALDKLVGALARTGRRGVGGVVLLTSRVSVELVQKTAAFGAPVLVAVSAPTTLAVDTAARAGVTLVAVARDDGFEVFTHDGRIAWP